MNEARKNTPLRAIRAKCRECSGGSTAEVRECPVYDCPLYPYRNGHNPARRGIGGKCGFSAKNPNSRRETTQENDSEGSYTTEHGTSGNGRLSRQEARP